MEENSEVQDILARLADNDLAYVMARRRESSNLKAAAKAGLKKGWWYGLGKDKQNELNAFAARLQRADAKAIIASNILENAIEDAARVQVDGLKERDPRVRLSASNEILKRVLGNESTVNVNVKQGAPFEIRWSDSDETDI